MNGQNPNNQINGQGGQNIANGVNPSVLGSVGPTPAVNQTPQPQVTPNANTVGQNVGTTLGTAQPVNPNPTPAAPVTPNQNIGVTPNVNQPAAQPINPSGQTTVTPGTEAAPIGNVNSEPVARPIPGTSGTPYQANSLTGNTVGVGTPTLGQDNLNSNGFTEPNKVENIGTVPPPNNQATTNQSKKKGMNKTLFVILIIVLIVAVAFGVYYFLNISNKVTVNVKEVTVGVGETLSDNISDYATISGKDASSCTLNTRNVDTSTLGDYQFTITCGDDQYTGTVKVSDIDAPDVTLNTVYKTINSTVTIDEFVAECTDPSGCTTTFANESTVNSYLATAGGPYTIEINATDDAGNSEVVSAELYVTPYAITFYRSCESPSNEVSGYQATKTVTDFFPMGNDGTGIVHLGVSQRIYTYVFTNADEYNSVIGDKTQTITFDGITGRAAYNDEDMTLQITTNLSMDTLNTEAGGAYPTTYNDLGTYYTNLSYVCSNTLPNNN